MSKKSAILESTKSQLNSYSLSKSSTPFPKSDTNKIKPPVANQDLEDNSHLFTEKKQELSWEEKAKRHMDDYRKAERIVIINFYTGGSPYKRGIMDTIYRGMGGMG